MPVASLGPLEDRIEELAARSEGWFYRLTGSASAHDPLAGKPWSPEMREGVRAFLAFLPRYALDELKLGMGLEGSAQIDWYDRERVVTITLEDRQMSFEVYFYKDSNGDGNPDEVFNSTDAETAAGVFLTRPQSSSLLVASPTEC